MPGVAEHRADAADHARAVVVVHDEHVTRRRQVDLMAVDADDARRLLLAEQRRRDVRPLVAAHDDQIHVVERVRRLRLAHRDPALLGDLRRVHERDRLVDDRREHTLQHRQREHTAVVVGDLAFVLDVQRRRRAAGESGEQPPDPFGERQDTVARSPPPRTRRR